MTALDDDSRDGDSDQLPRHTTPTWEVELLISGVAVFAMLQLPGWLDDRWFSLRPRLDASWIEPLEIIYVYSKGAALVLGVTFVSHLLLRARWIAQVGMHSVYPEGIRWDRLRMGPVQREVEQRHYVSADASIERADNRATTVFAIGVMLASMLLAITAIVLGGYVIAHWLVQLLDLRLDVLEVLLLTFAVVLVPLMVAIRIDRARGDRLAAGSRSRRWLARVFGFYGRLGLGQGANPSMALLSSHGGRIRTVVTTTAVIALATTASLSSYHIARDPLRLGQYDLFPRLSLQAAHVVDSAHYADTRNPDRDDAVPYIQSAVVVGPYLKLVVPYQPRTDELALRDTCSASRADTPLNGDTLLACLDRMHAVALDGIPFPAVHYDTGSDPRTDRPALVAMLDIRRLAPGRHLLRIARPTIPDGTAKPTPALPDQIPFWR